MKTLVVIDMQRNLLQPALERDECVVRSVISNIADLICEFKYHQWPIIMVQFIQYNSVIIPELLGILKNYKCWQLASKNQVDGSTTVLSWQRYWKWPTNFTVCGIYGEECVAETVSGIIVKEPKSRVEVMVDAIYPDYDGLFDGVNKEKHDKQMRLVTQGEWNGATFV